MFLYLSLARMFPVLQDLIDEPPDHSDHLTAKQYFKLSRRKSGYRLLISNLGFMMALAILAPLVRILAPRCRDLKFQEFSRKLFIRISEEIIFLL